MYSIDPRITERLRGPSWDGIREAFGELCNAVLGVADDTRAELTTIYVKFSISSEIDAPVYAVAWLKSSKNVVVGFALPESVEDSKLIAAPAGMKYKGITKYLRIVPDTTLPAKVREWAHAAFAEVSSKVDG